MATSQNSEAVITSEGQIKTEPLQPYFERNDDCCLVCCSFFMCDGPSVSGPSVYALSKGANNKNKGSTEASHGFSEVGAYTGVSDETSSGFDWGNNDISSGGDNYCSGGDSGWGGGGDSGCGGGDSGGGGGGGSCD